MGIELLITSTWQLHSPAQDGFIGQIRAAAALQANAELLHGPVSGNFTGQGSFTGQSRAA